MSGEERSFLASPAPAAPDTSIPPIVIAMEEPPSSPRGLPASPPGLPASPRGLPASPRGLPASPLASSLQRRPPFPVRSSGVLQINETCLEYLHIEIVALLSSEPPALQGSDPTATLALKLERIGFRVGQKIAERHCVARPRFSTDLDKIKFVCKEFWSVVFKKPQVDNLRTNNRGTYVLTDHRFRWLLSLGGPEVKDLALRYTHFPCGLIRGCLASLGVNCSVTADPSSLPACTFHVKIVGPSAS